MTLSGTLERRIVELRTALDRSAVYVAELKETNKRLRREKYALRERVERKNLRIAALRRELAAERTKRP